MTTGIGGAMLLLVALAGRLGLADGGVRLEPADSVQGYVARLLINESPFPGERGWVSEEDTQAAMLAILWVLESRLKHIPDGYKQEHVASERCADIIAVITAGGEKGQCDGFYRDASGKFIAVPRVGERIDYLLAAANRGQPGRFARLLTYAQGLATTYVKSGIEEADRRKLIRFASDIDLSNPAVWEHEQLAVKLYDIDSKVVVSLDEVAGSNAFMTRDEAGRALFNCVVLGQRMELTPGQPAAQAR